MSKKHAFISSLVRFFSKTSNVFVLESQMDHHPASKKTFFAASPVITFNAKGNNITINKNGNETKYKSNPWDALEKFRDQNKEWCFGFISYDLKNYTELLYSTNKELIEVPDIFFFVPKILIEINSEKDFIVHKGRIPEDLRKSEFRGRIKLEKSKQILKTDYFEKIAKAKHLINEGEIYEVNISHPIEFNFEGNPWDLYQDMRLVGPVPFGAYITCGDLQICSSSPERFISKKGNKISSQPIKGTISRDKENDEKTKNKLINSEKDKAENLMIVDLVRNDLNKIAKKNSVVVSKLFEIQTFETIHQMVSTIEAESNQSSSSIDILKACFPMGSMTGAPKIAAMKAIEEIEDYKRGIYSGAIGYFTPEDDFDFSVVIRTAIIENEKLIFPVGGAITSDSNPEEEWNETLLKAKAITNLIN
ncbi:MAG: aminodeoxychorismate synthase component I [Balneola sp.]